MSYMFTNDSETSDNTVELKIKHGEYGSLLLARRPGKEWNNVIYITKDSGGVVYYDTQGLGKLIGNIGQALNRSR